MKGNKIVVGVFTYLDDTLKAIRQVKSQGLDYLVYSPTIVAEIEEIAAPPKSPVRFVTFFGALCGLTFGFSLAIMCSLDYPLRVSAKSVVSIPGFFVIGYECFILFAALSTLAAMFHFCKIPNIFRKAGYDPRFNVDKFGVVVGCEQRDQIEHVSAALKQAGADEVSVREAF